MALRFVLANKNIDMSLSGMSDMKMLNENVEVASRAGYLSEDELRHIKTMMEENRNLAKLYCTGCNYCKPCPQGIDIPYLFEIMNCHQVYQLTDHAKSAYGEVIKGTSGTKSADASKCVSCGACEKKCPQKLPIIKQLQETHKALA
jgi:predicted aldo/keto reductase-like oxidoreductase